MRGGEIAVLILNEMQMLDQKIAAAWPVCQKGANFVERLRVDLATFRCARWTAAAAGFFGTRPRRILHVHRLTSARFEAVLKTRQSRDRYGSIGNFYQNYVCYCLFL